VSGFRSYGALGEAARAGQIHTAHFRKVPSQASVAGQWVDLSMAAGNPQPNYYPTAPLEAAVLSGMRGILHGDDKAPASMHVLDMVLCSPTAGFVGTYQLLDYLLYYPFVDLDDTAPQVMINDVPLPRYVDGEGVRAMLVTTAPTLGGGSFTYDYINQDGAAKTSPAITCNTTADSIATICTSQQATAAGGALFLPMATGDTGIREISGVTMLAPNGGLAALVLVRPLCSARISEVSVPSERVYLTEQPNAPRVEDGAYLGLVVNCAATVAAGTLAGRITFVWN
jgi:hypothetical protein